MFGSNKNGFETSHYVILAYFDFTLPVMMAELLSGKVIQLGARDTNFEGVSFPQTNQLANSRDAISRHLYYKVFK